MRRLRLMETLEELSDLAALSREKIDSIAREMTLIVNTEDLQVQLGEYYSIVAQSYMGIEAVDEARKYATMADEYWVRYGTEEHDNVLGMQRLWEEIERLELLQRMGPHAREHYEGV